MDSDLKPPQDNDLPPSGSAEDLADDEANARMLEEQSARQRFWENLAASEEGHQVGRNWFEWDGEAEDEEL